MRIDPSGQGINGVQADPSQAMSAASGQRAPVDPGSAARGSGVQVQLSTSSAQVSTLAQQAAAVSPVRTDQVDALRQTIRDGNYQVTNEQVAAAMYSDMFASGTTE
jgi:flagellar biosynthesis anti-sigma factor FlgM